MGTAPRSPDDRVSIFSLAHCCRGCERGRHMPPPSPEAVFESNVTFWSDTAAAEATWTPPPQPLSALLDWKSVSEMEELRLSPS